MAETLTTYEKETLGMIWIDRYMLINFRNQFPEKQLYNSFRKEVEDLGLELSNSMGDFCISIFIPKFRSVDSIIPYIEKCLTVV